MADEETAAPAQPTNWGRWGAEDERGAANHITPEVVRAAGAMIRTGKVYSLSLPVQAADVPVFPRRQAALHMMALDGGDYAAGLKRHSGVKTSDDYIATHTHNGTHIDGLAHVWYGDHIYNGFPGDSVRSVGAKRCGIEKLRSLVGRGVLLDMCKHRNETPLPIGTALTPEELEACAAAQGVELRTGDILLIRTGWLGSYDPKNPAPFFKGEPGLGKAAGEWMGERGFAGVGMDNFAIEAVPTEDGSLMPVHRRMIRDFGCYLMEFLVLDELAQNEAYEFLFVAAPLLITGGVGSPINPLAIC